MAGFNKTLHTLNAFDICDPVVCVGSWGVNGSSDPATSSIKGDIISSVTYSATGVYTVTLTDVGYSLLFANATVQLTGDSVDLYAQVGDYDASAKTIKVKLKTGSTNTAPPASNANSRINLLLVFSRLSLTR